MAIDLNVFGYLMEYRIGSNQQGTNVVHEGCIMLLRHLNSVCNHRSLIISLVTEGMDPTPAKDLENVRCFLHFHKYQGHTPTDSGTLVSGQLAQSASACPGNVTGEEDE